MKFLTNTHPNTRHVHSGGRQAPLADAYRERAGARLLPLHAGHPRVRLVGRGRLSALPPCVSLARPSTIQQAHPTFHTPTPTHHRFFLAAPLVSWMFGSWLLLGTTVFYICGVYMIEEDFLISDEVPPRLRLARRGTAVVDPNKPLTETHISTRPCRYGAPSPAPFRRPLWPCWSRRNGSEATRHQRRMA